MPKESITCPNCKRSFASTYSRKRHEKIHITKETKEPEEVKKEEESTTESVCSLTVYRDKLNGFITVQIHSQ